MYLFNLVFGINIPTHWDSNHFFLHPIIELRQTLVGQWRSCWYSHKWGVKIKASWKMLNICLLHFWEIGYCSHLDNFLWSRFLTSPWMIGKVEHQSLVWNLWYIMYLAMNMRTWIHNIQNYQYNSIYLHFGHLFFGVNVVKSSVHWASGNIYRIDYRYLKLFESSYSLYI